MTGSRNLREMVSGFTSLFTKGNQGRNLDSSKQKSDVRRFQTTDEDLLKYFKAQTGITFEDQRQADLFLKFFTTYTDMNLLVKSEEQNLREKIDTLRPARRVPTMYTNAKDNPVNQDAEPNGKHWWYDNMHHSERTRTMLTGAFKNSMDLIWAQSIYSNRRAVQFESQFGVADDSRSFVSFPAPLIRILTPYKQQSCKRPNILECSDQFMSVPSLDFASDFEKTGHAQKPSNGEEELGLCADVNRVYRELSDKTQAVEMACMDQYSKTMSYRLHLLTESMNAISRSNVRINNLYKDIEGLTKSHMQIADDINLAREHYAEIKAANNEEYAMLHPMTKRLFDNFKEPISMESIHEFDNRVISRAKEPDSTYVVYEDPNENLVAAREEVIAEESANLVIKNPVLQLIDVLSRCQPSALAYEQMEFYLAQKEETGYSQTLDEFAKIYSEDTAETWDREMDEHLNTPLFGLRMVVSLDGIKDRISKGIITNYANNLKEVLYRSFAYHIKLNNPEFNSVFKLYDDEFDSANETILTKNRETEQSLSSFPVKNLVLSDYDPMSVTIALTLESKSRALGGHSTEQFSLRNIDKIKGNLITDNYSPVELKLYEGQE